VLPGEAGRGVVRDRPEGGDRPRRAGGGGVLADPAPPVVHYCGELGEETPSFGIIGLWNPGRPERGGERDEIAMAAADAGVDHGGDVTGAGQVPPGHGLGQDLARVQACQFGGVQGAVQPLFRVAVVPAGSRRQGGLEEGAVAPFAGRGGLGGPHRVQDGQVVGVGQGLPAALGRGLPGAVAAGGDLREHAYRAGCPWVVPVARVVAVGVGGEAVVAGEFGAGRVPGAGSDSLTGVVKT
jgi:hypothetical protein